MAISSNSLSTLLLAMIISASLSSLSGCSRDSRQSGGPIPTTHQASTTATHEPSVTPARPLPARAQTTTVPPEETTPSPFVEPAPLTSPIDCQIEPTNRKQRRLSVKRLVTEQRTQQIGQTRKFLNQATPMYRDSLVIEFKKILQNSDSGNLHIAVCKVSPDGLIEQLDGFVIPQHDPDMLTTVTREYTELTDHRLTIQLEGEDPDHHSQINIDLIYSTGQPWLPLYRDEPQLAATGFLDLHLHQTGAMAFNGGWYWGSHEPGALTERLPHCDGEHGSFHEYGFLLKNKSSRDFLYSIAPKHDVDDFLKAHRGRTDPAQYLRSDDRKHQQVAFEHLRDAHARGLSLVISTMVENFTLTNLMSNAGKGNQQWDRNTMESIKRQLISIKKISDEQDWFEVVYDPWHARKVIGEGKLAVVIGAEFSNIFPASDGPWQQQLHDLYDLGLRHLQPVHKIDSQFNSTHNQGFPFDIVNIFHALNTPEIPNAPAIERFFYGLEEPSIGLTRAGYKLLDEMVRLNMIVDLSHSGLVSQIESSDYLLQQHNFYPWIYSHWAAKDVALLEQTKQVGGMIALGWGQPVPESTLVVSEVNLPNDLTCSDWQRQLYQRYKNYVDYGINFSLSTDMNGFTSVIQPNFGPSACLLSDEEKDRSDQVKTVAVMQEYYPDQPDWVNQYWAQGTPHIGLLPGVIYDLKEVLGIDTTELENSTENFLVMWERTYDQNRQPVLESSTGY